MNEHVFQILVGLVSFFGGILVKGLLNDVKQLTTKLQEMEVLVAGKYVQKSEFEAKIDALFEKLDRIDSKLDAKADRTECHQLRKLT